MFAFGPPFGISPDLLLLIFPKRYEQVLKCIGRAMQQVYGIYIEKQAFCPACLHQRRVGEARGWKWSEILKAISDGT